MPEDNKNPNDDLPFSNNINITQGVAVLASILVVFTGGKVHLDLQTQAYIVMAITGGAGFVTWVLHTFVNHPANQVAARAMVRAAIVRARGGQSLLAIFLVASLVFSLAACTTGGGIFGPQDPKTILKEVEAGAALAEATFESICPASSAPAFCADAMPNYRKAKDALNSVFLTADAAIALSGNFDSASVQTALAAVEKDWETLNTIVNAAQLRNAQLKGVTFRAIPLHE